MRILRIRGEVLCSAWGVLNQARLQQMIPRDMSGGDLLLDITNDDGYLTL